MLNKTEYLALNAETRFQVLINYEVAVKHVDSLKYLGFTVTRDGIGKERMKKRVLNGKRIVKCLNSL